MANEPPSYDPAKLDNLAGMLREILKKSLQNTDDMLPAKIITYDREKNQATVQPQIRVITMSNELLTRPPIASVPVLALGGGGFVVNFPLKEGDTGWIKANDRDISLYIQSAYQQSPPNTARLHNFSDGLFIPDVMAQYTIDEEDFDGNMVIQSLDNSVRIALWPDRLKVTAPLVEIDTPDARFTGNITAEGEITAFYDSPNFVTLTQHIHDQDNDSDGDSEQPTDPATPGI